MLFTTYKYPIFHTQELVAGSRFWAVSCRLEFFPDVRFEDPSACKSPKSFLANPPPHILHGGTLRC